MADEKKEAKVTHINDLVKDNGSSKDVLKVLSDNYVHQEKYEQGFMSEHAKRFNETYISTEAALKKAGVGLNDLAKNHKDKILSITADEVLKGYLPSLSEHGVKEIEDLLKEKKTISAEEKFEIVQNFLNRELGHDLRYSRGKKTMMDSIKELVDSTDVKVGQVLSSAFTGENQGYTITKTVQNYFSSKVDNDLSKYHPVNVRKALKEHLKDTYNTHVENHKDFMEVRNPDLYQAFKMHKDNKIQNNVLEQLGMKHYQAQRDGKVVKMDKKEYHHREAA